MKLTKSSASVATRIVDRGPVATPLDDDDDDDGCMLMEVRPRVKIQPEEDEQRLPNLGTNNNASFMSQPGFQAIGQKLKEVNDTLGTLQSLGIQKVASLPELVLVGDQSAGKSSIMSAIAGLNLPHNTGVCTRCPVHIRLSRSIDTDWSCIITLQQDYAFKPGDGPPSREDVTPRNPFPPWVKQNREIKDFARFRGKVDSIEHALRWAQVAILNHDHDHEQYKPRSNDGSDSDFQDGDEAEALAKAEATTQAKFSPNTVALEIRGPDLPDLSFYDLPGVFDNARHVEDQYLSDVVKNLTREYISHEKAIILCAVPMNTDAMTSTTSSIIQEMNAVKRCLGIMTKADLLPRGSHQQWLDMLKGTVHQNGLGYFITSRPDKDLDEQAAFEEAFFNRQVGPESHAETPTWPLEFAEYNERCGVVRLKDFLSHKLAEDFAKSLPAVKAILEKRLHKVVSELQTLPELPANPELEIRKALLEFTNLARTCLQGQDFQGAWKVKNNNFSNSILKMKPKYVVKPPTPDVIDLDSDTPGTTPTPKRRSADDHYAGSQATPSKRRANGTNSVPRSGGTVKAEENINPFSPRLSVAAVPTPAGLRAGAMPRSRTLEEVRAVIEHKRQPGMPNSIPDTVYTFLCQESVQHWGKVIQLFVADTMKLVYAEMHKALDIAFASLKKRTAYREARIHLDAFLKTHQETLMQQLSYAYKLERHQLYTSNQKFFEINQESELRELQRHRHHYRWLSHTGQQSIDRPRPIEQLSEEEKREEATRVNKEGPKMGPDPFSQELQVASYVRGYYLTAAGRYIDNASLHMISGMFPAVAKDINFHLDKKLGLVNQPDRALFDRLMEEEPTTADRRNQLKEDKKKFDKAMESILALEMSANIARDEGEGDDYMMDIGGGDPAMMSGALNGSSIYGLDI
jgi:GTP-binding protein EngB required for normal cell division